LDEFVRLVDVEDAIQQKNQENQKLKQNLKYETEVTEQLVDFAYEQKERLGRIREHNSFFMF
jgi:hypothetical protein